MSREHIREIWHRIELWLELNAPEVAATLQAGATEQQVDELESLLGTDLPSEFRESLLIHNGQSPCPLFCLIDDHELLSVDRIR